MANIFQDLPVPAGNGVGAAVDISGYGREKTITVEGPFSGSIILEISNEAVGGPYIQTLAITNPGKRKLEIAARFMRVRRSGTTPINPGTPNVDVAGNDNGGLFADLPVPLGNGIGAAVDVSQFGSFKTATAAPDGVDFLGIVHIEISEDNVSWSECFSFQKGDHKSKEFIARWMRARREGVPPGVPPDAVNVDIGAINDCVSDVGSRWDLVGPYNTAGPHNIDCEQLVQVDTTNIEVILQLPAVSAANAGCELVVKRVAGILDHILRPAGMDTIDSQGGDSHVQSNGLISLNLVSDGISNWMLT